MRTRRSRIAEKSETEDKPSPSRTPKVKKVSSAIKNAVGDDSNLVEAYYAYKGHPSKWAQLSTADRKNVVESAFKGRKNIKCLGKSCEKRFNNVDEAVEHISRCILPDYFLYVGKVSEFRSLDQKLQKAIIKGALLAASPLPCLNEAETGCTYKSGHPYGLLYHLERCNRDPKKCPWKCYRCGHFSNVLESREHLDKCHGKGKAEDEDGNELENGLEGISRAKNELQQIDGSNDSSLKRKYGSKFLSPDVCFKKQRIPLKKFYKNTNSSNPNRRLYLSDIIRSRKKFEEERKDDNLCDCIMNAKKQDWRQISFSESSETFQNILHKRSIPICLPSKSADKVFESKNSLNINANEDFASEKCKERLSLFEPKNFFFSSAEKNSESIGSLVYCGGPISFIRCCPKRCENGYECVAVSTFHDEENLENNLDRSSLDYIQFWLFGEEMNKEICLWFILEVEVGIILSMEWCPSIRDSEQWSRTSLGSTNSNLLGLLAVGGSLGSLHIYSIFEDVAVKNTNSYEEYFIFKGVPYIILKNTDGYELGPIISLSWTAFSGSSYLAAVSEIDHGQVFVWNLNALNEEPKVIVDNEDISPRAVAFCDLNLLGVSFYDRAIRMYDVTTGEYVFEDSSRTGGPKICACEYIYPGMLTYQCAQVPVSLERSTHVYSMNSSCYVSLDVSRKKVVATPICNRHEVNISEVSVCPQTGAVLSVGVDGRLKLSLNGRVFPRNAIQDLPFTYSRVLMTLTRKENQVSFNTTKASLEFVDSKDDNPPFKIPNTNLEMCAENTYLEFSFDDEMYSRVPVDLISLDIRTESLNRVHVSQISGCLAVCGGEAGILFFLPYSKFL